MAVSRGPARAGRDRSRPTFTLVVLILASLTLLSLAYRGAGSRVVASVQSDALDVVAPVETALQAGARPVVDFFAGAASYGRLKSENARLHDEVTRLQAEAATSARLEKEVAALSALDHLRYVGSIPSVAAEVVAPGSSNFQLTVLINRGRANGVATGMPVVAGSGLVGRVVAVSSHEATVLLITDPSSAVGVRIGSSGVLGVAAGNGAGRLLSVEYVEPTARLARGATAVTALVKGGTYPPGIPVGRVRTFSAAPGQTEATVTLEPFVDFSALQYVRVLRWTPTS